MSDTMVGRQGAKSLKFRGSKEGVTLLLQRSFSSAVNAHYSKLLIITAQAGGSSRFCGNTTLLAVVSKAVFTWKDKTQTDIIKQV